MGIALSYFAAGIAWILFSDGLVAAIPSHDIADQVQSVKGIIFIGVTSLLLLGLVSRYRREITHQFTERDQHRQVRDHLTAALAHLSPGPTPEVTAAAVCASVRRMPGIDLAALIAFEETQAITLGIDSSGPMTIVLGGELPAELEGELRRRSAGGPWVDDATSGEPALAAWVGTALGGLIGVPIRDELDLHGVLLSGTAQPAGLNVVAEQLSTAVELAGVAEALIIPSLRARQATAQRRAVLGSIIDNSGFAIVFQPIVDLRSRRAVGFEALTRFNDGSSPLDRYVEAAELGMSAQLEAASLAAAVVGATLLPRRAWLSLNASAALLLDPALPGLLRGTRRSIILEITEHEAVSNYAAVREALARIGRSARLAVDDAGAGFASLRHLAELRPAIVKLDRDLITRVDTDTARQALIAGLRHYADRSGCTLVAEGVEAEAELEMLLELGVTLGQGYLFGSPGPAAAFARGAFGPPQIGDPAPSVAGG